VSLCCAVRFQESLQAIALIFRTDAVRDGPAAEVELEDPAVAVGSGYAESKWVAERVLSRASAVVPALETVVVRVGQLAGGPTGAWNANEWFPAIVRSGPLLGCLPEQDAVCSRIACAQRWSA
jgi:thioester reductase-like protein